MDNLHTETRQIAARLRGARMTADTVSYTHLTLPTILRV